MSEQTENKTETSASQSANNVVSLPKEWPLRLAGSLVLLAVIGFFASVTVTIKESLVSKKFESLQQDFYDFTSKCGFTVDDVVVQGRKRTSLAEVAAAANLSRKDNIIEADVYAIKSRLEALPWVKKAVVKKSYLPNVVSIALLEKKVSSLWQLDERFHPIDEDGKVIDAVYTPDKPILLIVGEGAPENINGLMEIIKKDNGIFKRIKVANYISKRRWNLVLDDIREGITIKLPEKAPGKAWKKLLKLNTTKGILKRKLTIIDLRLSDKVVVKLRKDRGNKDLKLNNGKESKS